MRREFAFALIGILSVALAAAQQAAPPTPPAAATPSAQTVYYAGPGVTAPELLPAALIDLPTGHCKKLDGKAVLTAIVDTHGVARNVYFLRPAGNDLDKEAIQVVTADRFKPGTHEGTPAAVDVAIELDMKACIVEQKDSAGQKAYLTKLRSLPDQKIQLQQPPAGSTLASGGGLLAKPNIADTTPRKIVEKISAPVPLRQPEAVYSDKARKERISGVCIVSLTVDSYGMPQHLSIVRSLEPSLDQNALYAVSRYRFKPGMKEDGTPVAVYATVEVDFHLY